MNKEDKDIAEIMIVDLYGHKPGRMVELNTYYPVYCEHEDETSPPLLPKYPGIPFRERKKLVPVEMKQARSGHKVFYIGQCNQCKTGFWYK